MNIVIMHEMCDHVEIQKNANRNINAKGYMVGEHITCNCEYKILSNVFS